MAARFGEMLLDRRRQLGLSIQQVANTIKIRPQIIEFFETGNFASMPPRGYAQGMISTYARFLGLNPRQVVNAYFDELMAYERETSQRGGRFQDAAGYVNTRSSTENGRFLMIEGGRSSRYGQRPQQAGYVTETGSGQEIREQRDRFRNTLPPSDSALPQSLGNVSDPRAGYGDGGYSARGMRLASAHDRRSDLGGRDGARQGGSAYTRDPYSSSRGERPRSNRSAERASMRNGAAPSGRTRQQGRPGSSSRAPQGRSGARGRSPQPQGPQFDQRLILAGLGVIAVLLILIVFLLMRGCTPAATTDTATKATTQQVASGSSSSKSSDSDASDSSDTSSSSSSKKAEDTTVKVKVSVAKGKTAWIEVKVDGKSVYGAQATGPFEQEYTPESSIEITTSKPSDVTVTKNGEKVRYDTKTSGVARVTITVPKKASDSDGDASSDGSTSADGTDTQSADGTSTDTSADGTSSDSATGNDSAGTSTYSSTGTTTAAQTDSSQSAYSSTGTSQ